ncbi:MFS general substrate transporter [Xylariaceae sp. FL0594]|nr:MFS general substrate transporter [Xylariaceae sp. FL0594]
MSKRLSDSSTRFTSRPSLPAAGEVEKAVSSTTLMPAQACDRISNFSSGSGPYTNPVPTTPPPDDVSEERFRPRSFKFWSVITSIYLGLFLVALDRTIIGTATPQITQEFHSLGDIGWYGSSYQLTTAASQLLFGRIYKFYEIKRTFLITVATFEVGSVICGAAPNSVVFIVGRAIAGLGAAGIFSGVTIIMITMVPLRKRPMFQGLFGIVFGLASVLGPLVGGALTDAASWRWCFYINLPIGAVAAVFLGFILDPSKFPHPPASIWAQIWRLDPVGTLLFVPAVVSLLVALEWGGSSYPWSNWRIVVLLVLFGLLFIAFGAVQVLMPKTATVPVRIIRRRSILAATVFMFAIAGSFLMAIYFLPIWLVKGSTAMQSGIDTLPFVLSLVVSSTLSGVFTQKVGYYVPAMIACPSLLAAGQGLMSTFRVDERASHWIGYQVIAGFGLGLGMQASSLAAQAVLPAPDVPIGIAIMFFAQQLGGGIFTSVGQNLLSTYLVSHLDGIPGISPSKVTGQGAADLVSSVPPEYRLAVRTVYNQAISRIFLCAMGVALVAVVASLGMEWKNLKHTGQPGRPASVAQRNTPLSKKKKTQDQGWSFGNPSLEASRDSNSIFYDADDTLAQNTSSSMNVSEALAPGEFRMGCERCEHCRRSNLLASGPIIYGRNPHTQVAVSSRSAFSEEAELFKEAARLTSMARDTIAQLEETMRPLTNFGLSIFAPHSMHGSLSRSRREPTTEELVENVRHVPVHLAEEESGYQESARLMEKRREKGKERESIVYYSATPSPVPTS